MGCCLWGSTESQKRHQFGHVRSIMRKGRLRAHGFGLVFGRNFPVVDPADDVVIILAGLAESPDQFQPGQFEQIGTVADVVFEKIFFGDTGFCA